MKHFRSSISHVLTRASENRAPSRSAIPERGRSTVAQSRNLLAPGYGPMILVSCHLVLVTGFVIMNGILVHRIQSTPVVRGTPLKKITATTLPPALGRYGDLIMRASSQFKVDPYLIRAVMLAESDERPRAISHADARGLMQVMPGTAADLGVKRTHALFDPATNITLGTRYLAMQLDRFDGDVRKALIAYNAGPNTVLQGRRLPAETRRYVPKVLWLRTIRGAPAKACNRCAYGSAFIQDR